MFSVAIPALQPPADPDAQQFFQGFGAAAIAVNDPIQDDAWRAASRELQARRAAHLFTDITREEVTDAEYRLHMVYHEVIYQRHYAQRQGPLDGMQAAMMNHFQALNNSLGEIQGQLQAMQAADQARDVRIGAIEGLIGAIEGQLQAMEATVDSGITHLRGDVIEMRNRELRAFNRRRNNDVAQHYGPLQPLLAERARNGPGILGRPRVQLRQLVAIGIPFPSPPFPATVHAVGRMTLADIHELAITMDDDFGIVHGDNIDACRAKVIRAITGQ